MTMTIGIWVIPLIVTIICIYYTLKGSYSSYFGNCIEPIFLVPAILAWLIYYMVMYYMK